MVPREGLEPSRGTPIRPSNVRVCQFRHLGVLLLYSNPPILVNTYLFMYNLVVKIINNKEVSGDDSRSSTLYSKRVL